MLLKVMTDFKAIKSCIWREGEEENTLCTAKHMEFHINRRICKELVRQSSLLYLRNVEECL
jgi:hypothetical protein